ncbi:hypothetical protein CLCR_09327 [Cladophialophora carrionii]|uniref:Uncharacterized protein n=1 Tax=Cladophialophora carrionii TaxID=86049 RepID=A0A1C1CSJ6_9EURO|nr:hypothetical protein CLCR_09327 [Cladophialophora carrionii]
MEPPDAAAGGRDFYSLCHYGSRQTYLFTSSPLPAAWRFHQYLAVDSGSSRKDVAGSKLGGYAAAGGRVGTGERNNRILDELVGEEL